MFLLQVTKVIHNSIPETGEFYVQKINERSDSRDGFG